MESLLVTPTEDAAAAAMLLSAVDPGADGRIPARVQAIDAELDAALEHARLEPAVKLPDYVMRCRRLIFRRNALYSRLERAVPGSLPGLLSPAEETTRRVVAVRRWRAGDELRAIRAQIISVVRSELEEIEIDLQGLRDSYRGGNRLAVPPHSARAQAGLSGNDDEFLFRAEGLIGRRRALLGRLGRLDPHGDPLRARQVAAAIEQAGGDEQVIAAIAPQLTTVGAGKLADGKKRLAQLRARAEVLDPETDRASVLIAQAEELAASVEQTRQGVEQEQAEAAGTIVAAARSGRFDAILQLEQAAAATSVAGLIAPLSLTRGDTTDWPAVVEEMVRVHTKVGANGTENGPGV